MSSQRTALRTFAACALAAASLGLAGIAAAQAKLKWAHVYETSEPFHKYSVWAGNEIKRRTNGRYEVQVFPASTLGKEADINQGLTLGTVDIIMAGPSFAGRLYPPLAVSAFPFIFRDAEHQIKYARSDVFKELAKGYDDKSGNHITALGYFGTRHVTSSAARPVARPEDMKGLKIRVPDTPATLIFPRALGANPTPIALAEVYLALQNNTVDAQESPLPTIDARKFFEVQKNISLTGHIVESLLTICSGTLWARLSDEDKKVFGAVMQEAADKAGHEVLAAEARLVQEFRNKGNNVIAVDKRAFREAVLKATRPTDHGLRQRDYERILAIQ
ncbi:sialic acid TRAP transporter substrate-binding protein SiaP [Verminephrobacter eiseniae]|uniref:TRAP dicarboxylate transporter, DctP subunit n=1 Tax=Verminephrobacter eiseniae (strain EF01-2) TaxID=391735 RepID=A1WI43_VEREI|nr:sialic acid TRAP transporter substrate-binding protein SiaP [Verminephrobacter eiseniae]ABM57300.1 TRAP dicarboxylate transporter, DctP subunit [Verminephrobacter eiseniae EF01-2]MCW5234325.1 DctP family TRAP transporter solute-binding subunit [Verminephrobacter eiseniae]MCW5282927.1 DctP family TRAP transporter solute-binding subunit [Verminephrobacter eiseniae]MCW5294117.1 DctP family TRAP transporter solute-binding subunit [Verminephrobacter eiseniae]MCW5303242.1 DctP family TRAP transpo